MVRLSRYGVTNKLGRQFWSQNNGLSFCRALQRFGSRALRSSRGAAFVRCFFGRCSRNLPGLRTQ